MGKKIPGNDVSSVWEFLPIMPVQHDMLLRNEKKKKKKPDQNKVFLTFKTNQQQRSNLYPSGMSHHRYTTVI